VNGYDVPELEDYAQVAGGEHRFRVVGGLELWSHAVRNFTPNKLLGREDMAYATRAWSGRDLDNHRLGKLGLYDVWLYAQPIRDGGSTVSATVVRRNIKVGLRDDGTVRTWNEIARTYGLLDEMCHELFGSMLKFATVVHGALGAADH
jgi:hypothetical protein